MSTEVIITGTGVPHLTPGRAGPGVLIRSGEVSIQFDAGRATALRLCEANTQPTQLDALFITHHHSDHLTGLIDVVFARWLQSHGHHEPLPIVAPEGPAARYLERMLDPWADDIAVRKQHVEREDGPEPKLIFYEAAPNEREVWRSGDLHVSARLVHHEPVTPAVAYRIETPDGAVVISGDTIACDEVAELARGADVLVHEAFRRRVLEPAYEAMPHLAKIAVYHADTEEVGGVAQRAGVPTLVLTHLIPAPRNQAEKQGFVDDVRRGGYDGAVVVADDLETVRL